MIKDQLRTLSGHLTRCMLVALFGTAFGFLTALILFPAADGGPDLGWLALAVGIPLLAVIVPRYTRFLTSGRDNRFANCSKS